MEEQTNPVDAEKQVTQKLLNTWLAEHRIDRRTFLKWSGMLTVAGGALVTGATATSQTAFAASWVPKTAPLMTQWAAQVSPTNAWPLYPRPQMQRTNWQNLNGVWQFDWSTGNDSPPFNRNLAQSILVPYPIESALSGIMVYQPYMWYRTTFTVPAGWSGQHVLLHFGAVDWQATVYLNGHQIGTHTGGYSAFSFDVTSNLNGGTNELIVRVWDATDKGSNPAQPVGKQRINHGGIFYTTVSGIWQTVWLEPVPAASITRLDMTPDIDNHRLLLTVQGTGINGQTVHAVATTNGTTIGSATGTVGSVINIPVPNPHLWSPQDPFLYDLQVSLVNGSSTVDQVTSYFGMRIITLETVGGVLRPVINHQFQFLVGPLDQGFWPDGIYTAPTDDALKFDIQQIKNLGFNAVRKHMKVESDRWFYWADHLGLVVWQDMPAQFGTPSATDIANYQTEFREIVQQHLSTPSIITWTCFNEGWGEPDSATVQQVVNNVRSWDPNRLVDDASGWNDDGVGDIVDTHNYPTPMANPPTSTRAAFSGEYGGIKDVIAGHLWVPGETGNTPSMAVATSQYVALMKTNQSLMITPGSSGAIYTQITDVEGELNGLYTYDRAVLKFNAGQLMAANQAAIAATVTDAGSYYNLMNVNSGLMLDVTGASTASGGLIVQSTSSGATSQQWQRVPAGSGYYYLLNRNSGLVLDVTSASTATGIQLEQWTRNGGTNQQWQFNSINGAYTIVNKNSGLLVDASGASTASGTEVIQWTSNGGTNQQWRLVPVPTVGFRYELVNRNSGLVIDVNAGSTANGGTIIQYPSRATPNQTWQFVDAGNGHFTLINVNSGLALEVPGFSTANGTPLDQWDTNGGTNQQWLFTSVGGGYYTIKNSNSGLVLEVHGLSTASTTPIDQWVSDGGPNQQWSLVEVS